MRQITAAQSISSLKRRLDELMNPLRKISNTEYEFEMSTDNQQFSVKFVQQMHNWEMILDKKKVKKAKKTKVKTNESMVDFVHDAAEKLAEHYGDEGSSAVPVKGVAGAFMFYAGDLKFVIAPYGNQLVSAMLVDGNGESFMRNEFSINVKQENFDELVGIVMQYVNLVRAVRYDPDTMLRDDLSRHGWSKILLDTLAGGQASLKFAISMKKEPQNTYASMGLRYVISNGGKSESFKERSAAVSAAINAHSTWGGHVPTTLREKKAAPKKAVVHGYSDMVYTLMFEAMFDFLENQKPERLYYTPSKPEQKDVYMNALVTNEGRTKALGYDAEFDDQAGMFIVTPIEQHEY